MPKYLILNTGKETTKNDPQRGIWYAANGTCGYWTDDWSKLSSVNGIPCCPVCSCVGMQCIAADWYNVPEEFLKLNPHYDEWLMLHKEYCGRSTGKSFLIRYKDWYDYEYR